MSVQIQALVQPVRPRLSPQLDGWVEEVDIETSLQRNLVESIDFAGVERLEIDDCVIENCSLAAVRLNTLEVTDARFKRLEGAGIRTRKTELLRVQLLDTRLTGSDFPEASFEDCVFHNVKLDDVGFRFARFKRVRFENCMLARTDFSHASFLHVSFVDCDLNETNFQGASCNSVDLGTEDLTACKGILGLKGARISDEQLIQIAPLLASELGFKVGSN